MTKLSMTNVAPENRAAELAKRVAHRQWFADSVETGDYVSFEYNGLIRYGRVVESVRLRQLNPFQSSVRGWLDLEMTVDEQEREDCNGKVPSQFKRFSWNSMLDCCL